MFCYTRHMKSFNQLVGENVKNIRRQNKISQEALGFMLNLTRSSIINIEEGRSGFNTEYVVRLSKLCNCEITDIIPVNYKFTYPAISDFKARKLTEKHDKLSVKIEDIKRQQNEILKTHDIDFQSLHRPI